MYPPPTTRPHAVDLPEIAFNIAKYMDTADILSCSAVCKSFYIAFSPMVWEDLHFGHPCKHNYDQTPFARDISLKRLIPTNPDILTQDDDGALAHQLLETLKSKAQWTRSLSIHSHDSVLPLKFGNECTRLSSITMEGLSLDENKKHPREYWAHCRNIIKRNRSQLLSLTLNNWTNDHRWKPSRGEPLWNPILNCSQALNLRSLTLNKCHIRGRHLKDFWEICTRLEALDMRDVELDLSLPPEPSNKKRKDKYGTLTLLNSDMQGDHPKSIVRFPRLKELNLVRMVRCSSKDQVYLLIRHCPQLQTLKWQGMIDPTSDFKELFLASTWQDLNSVTITGQLGTYTDESYRQMLQAFRKPIRRFEVNNSGIQQETFNVLRTQHFITLESFDCINSLANTSPWVIEVLTSCPGLQRLRAKIVNARDITASKTWICRGLEEITVFIDMGFPNNGSFRRFTEEEFETCRSIFRRLADFKRLKVLDMLSSHHWASLSPTTPLDSADHLRNIIVPLPLRLKAGLDHLANSTNLEKVCFFGGRNTVRMKELTWIVDHWKNLESLKGRWQVVRGTADSIQDKYFWTGKLRAWLKDHGIDATGSWYELYNLNTWVGTNYEDCCDSEDEDANKGQ
ncbi:hypothetical protein BGZ80_000429 [Entomortierella chlamydospora]|uniref:F-box domain-containing protein n=1 Tax=Entomortierella chlamydospora TaxID=101097 RepID=A0A9P6MT37_9FUNG|nr:hypothetical protein BGZ80_000429 [Entomortierella chlamydospora]